MNNRNIGEPERRGVLELRPFRYRPGHTGTLGATATVTVFDNVTEADITTTVFGGAPTVDVTAGVISTTEPAAFKREQVMRVHFVFDVDNVPYDEYRLVIVE